MTALLLVLVAGLAAAVAWLGYEVLKLRRGGPGVGAGGESAAKDLDTLFEAVDDLARRLEELDGRVALAFQRVGAVAYDAYGDVAGALSRSIALLNDEGAGVVLTHLVGRSDSRFFVKGVMDGRGEEPLSPEELDAVRRALGS